MTLLLDTHVWFWSLESPGKLGRRCRALLEDPANAFIRQIPGVVGVGGGVPIKAGNETIGGVGVSGAPGGEKDEV